MQGRRRGRAPDEPGDLPDSFGFVLHRWPVTLREYKNDIINTTAMKNPPLPFVAIVLMSSPLVAAPPEYKWREQEIDKIEIGYGIQLADVDGDGKTDIVLADKKTSLARISSQSQFHFTPCHPDTSRRL
jgi:hypothetical protein